MGTAAAYSLSKTNSRVLVMDRYGVGNEYCSSNDVNRVFRFSYGSDEYYTRMAVKSLKLWRELEKESKQEFLIATGLLLLQGESEESNGFNEASYKTLSRLKLGVEELDGAGLKRRFPQFRSERGILDLQGGVLLASKLLSAMTGLVRSKGVRFLKDEARIIHSSEDMQVETTTGQRVRCRKVVVTIGPWSGKLLREGLTKVTPTRQQLIYFKPRRGLDRFRPKSCPVFFTDHHYGLPAAGIDGVKLSPKELREEVDPETANRVVDKEQIENCREVCRRFIPDLADGEIVHSKVCLYDMTVNSDFVLDQDPENPDVVYGYGFSGHGFKFAPLIGRLIAELVREQKPSLDLSRFTILSSRRRPSTVRGQLGQGE